MHGNGVSPDNETESKEEKIVAKRTNSYILSNLFLWGKNDICEKIATPLPSLYVNISTFTHCPACCFCLINNTVLPNLAKENVDVFWSYKEPETLSGSTLFFFG